MSLDGIQVIVLVQWVTCINVCTWFFRVNAGALSPTLSPALTETEERLPLAIGRACAVMLFIMNDCQLVN